MSWNNTPRGGKRGNQNRNRYSQRSRGNRSRGSRRGGMKTPKRLPRHSFISEVTHTPIETKRYAGTPFTTYNLHGQLQQNLDKLNFTHTTEIQEKTIPLILSGNNVLGISETGSGKTGAFLTAMIQKLLTNPQESLMVVAPTRELAQQIAKEAITLVKGTNIYISLIIGGESVGRQLQELRRGNRLIVGTPGRLKDMINRQALKPNNIRNIIIDEVDRMLDMGFIDDIKYIYHKLGQNPQTLLFSATFNTKIETIVNSLISQYETVRLATNVASKNVKQAVIDYKHNEEKAERLLELLHSEELQKAIIFVETKRYADRVGKFLEKQSFPSGVIHGDKRQNVRRRIISQFRSSRLSVLVATNVAARGIDISDITHVINLDEPTDYDEYIHRIGRTGRNGKTGTAYTFVKAG